LYPDDRVVVDVTVELNEFTAVDPEVLLIDGSARFDRTAYVPARVVKLVVEVRDTTKASRKLQSYAAAGIPQYWVVDPRPEAGFLLRHTEPMGEHYHQVRRYDVGEGAELLDAAAVLAGH
jgi:Uma2 family endonuclease